MLQFSSPTFTSPLRTRPTNDEAKFPNPFTPIRDLFRVGRDYLKSSPTAPSGRGTITLGKRRRTSSESDESRTRSSPPSLPNSSSPPSSPSTVAQPSSSPSIVSSPFNLNRNPAFLPHPTPTPSRRRAPVALQNTDDTHNAIVITALEDIPFCCHEDLVTMSRARLVAVAHSLNAKLPAALRIDISDRRTDISIRKSIEVLVGISKPVVQITAHGVEPPGAPKADRLRKKPRTVLEDVDRSVLEKCIGLNRDASASEDIDMDTPSWPPSSPGLLSSPLAKRAIIRSTRLARASELGNLATTGTPKLARLEEEDESSMVSVTPEAERQKSLRASKRRKISGSGFAPRGKGFRRWSESVVRRNEVELSSLMNVNTIQSPSQPLIHRRISSVKMPRPSLPSPSFLRYQTPPCHDDTGAGSKSSLHGVIMSSGDLKGRRKRSRSMDRKLSS